MSYEFHPLAENEFLDHASYYRKNGGEKVSLQFNAQVTKTIRQITEFPQSAPVVDDRDRRKALVRGYPFGIVYRYYFGSRHIKILAVADTRRRPQYWSDRQ